MDAQSDALLWSERYDREMADVFEVQDEIARKIAEALRVTLSPPGAGGARGQADRRTRRPTTCSCAAAATRGGMVRQDLEFALQLFENAVAQDPGFALAYAAMANVCAVYHYNFEREASWLARARDASQKAIALQPDLPEAKVAQAWILYASGDYDQTLRIVRAVVERKRDTESAYYLLLRALFSSGQYQEIARVARGGDRGERQRTTTCTCRSRTRSGRSASRTP